jgi:DNA-binding CsgD family transcriptional regulator
MSETGPFPALIGAIYDAALEPARWSEALPHLARFVGGPSAAIWSEDVAAASASVTCACGFDAGYVEAYLAHYADLDLSRSAIGLAEVGEPFARSGVVSNSDFSQTPYYRHWVRPQGLIDCMYTVLDRAGTRTTLFAVSRRRHDGSIGKDMWRRMRLVTPHLRRAALIGQAVARERRTAAALADTLDGLSAATLLVDASGRVVHANAAADALIAARSVLSRIGGRLRARRASDDKALQDALRAARAGDDAVGAKGVALPLAGPDGEDYVARVLPLNAGARQRVGRAFAATAAVYVTKAELPVVTPATVIARRYRLTPMELRVLTVLVETGGGLSGIADALGVSAETVKTHLGNVYEKTGVRRQADLVKLALRFSASNIG